MRYRKGAISINESRDIPLLLLIRDSRAITLQQLHCMLPILNIETNRNSAYWRIRRLEQNGFIEQLKQTKTLGCPVYAITHEGLGLLEFKGYSLLSLGSFSRNVIHDSEVLHMTEINDIRLTLLKSGRLRKWKNELQVLSENLAFYGETTKDYDAQVTVDTAKGPRSFGLEYERTAKSAARYREIRKMIDEDLRSSFVLYLSPNQELMFLLAQELCAHQTQVVFGLISHFHRDGIKMRVLVPGSQGNSLAVLEELLIANQDDQTEQTLSA